MKTKQLVWLLLLTACLGGTAWGQKSLYEKYATHREWNVGYMQDFQFDTAVGPMDVILLQARNRRSWKKMLLTFNVHFPEEQLRNQTLSFFADRNNPAHLPPMQLCNGERRVCQTRACLVFVAADTRTVTLFFPRSERQSLHIIQYQLKYR